MIQKRRIQIDHIVEVEFVVHLPVNKIVAVVVAVCYLLLVLMVTLSLAMASVTTISINCTYKRDKYKCVLLTW